MAKWKTTFHVVLLITIFTVLPTQSAWPANAVVFFWFSLFTFYRKVTTGRTDNRKYVFLYSLTVVRFLTINNRNRFFYIKQNLFIFFHGLENFLKQRKCQSSKEWSPSRGRGGGGGGGTNKVL